MDRAVAAGDSDGDFEHLDHDLTDMSWLSDLVIVDHVKAMESPQQEKAQDIPVEEQHASATEAQLESTDTPKLNGEMLIIVRDVKATTEHMFGFNEKTTVAELATGVENITKIPPSKMILLHKEIHQIFSGDSNEAKATKTLQEIGIKDGDYINLVLKDPEHFRVV